jgi:hypothetical protein
MRVDMHHLSLSLYSPDFDFAWRFKIIHFLSHLAPTVSSYYFPIQSLYLSFHHSYHDTPSSHFIPASYVYDPTSFLLLIPLPLHPKQSPSLYAHCPL